MNNMHVKKGDVVVVNAGVDKGVKGKVLEAMPKDNKVVVEGVNIRIKHTRPKKAGEEGGLIKKECPVDASKVNLYCSKCNAPRRVKIELVEENKKGKKEIKKIRHCAKCGEEIK